MSRGLGNVQRKVLEVLQARDGSCALHELVFLVYAPFDGARDGDVSAYKLTYCDLYKRDRTAYVATWRAVQTLKRRGIVTTVVVHIKSELAPLLAPAERRWISVKLAEQFCLPESTLIVANDGWSDPRRLTIAQDWRAWAEQQGYRPLQHEPIAGAEAVLEVWARTARTDPYLVYVPPLPGRKAASLDICPSRERAEQVLSIVKRLFLEAHTAQHEQAAQ
jgi:hypothetical protein